MTQKISSPALVNIYTAFNSFFFTHIHRVLFQYLNKHKKKNLHVLWTLKISIFLSNEVKMIVVVACVVIQILYPTHIPTFDARAHYSHGHCQTQKYNIPLPEINKIIKKSKYH